MEENKNQRSVDGRPQKSGVGRRSGQDASLILSALGHSGDRFVQTANPASTVAGAGRCDRESIKPSIDLVRSAQTTRGKRWAMCEIP
ncbi:hypothetical protein, partial [Paraburkholderia sp. DGU8]|uniref:hypothetical protein n=1 Tax=Paraburkholderia sp. DGU8 TaxID=3161997 RepID=UPI003467E267